MYLEFKVKEEKEKPFAKYPVLCRVQTFLTTSSRVEGKVIKKRKYMGTIRIYNNRSKAKMDIDRVFGKIGVWLQFDNKMTGQEKVELMNKGYSKFVEKVSEEEERVNNRAIVKAMIGDDIGEGMLDEVMKHMNDHKKETKPQSKKPTSPPPKENNLQHHFSKLDLLSINLREALAIPYEQNNRSEQIQKANQAINEQYNLMVKEGLFNTSKEAKKAYKRMIRERTA
jgi:hypothetical protein